MGSGQGVANQQQKKIQIICFYPRQKGGQKAGKPKFVTQKIYSIVKVSLQIILETPFVLDVVCHYS